MTKVDQGAEGRAQDKVQPGKAYPADEALKLVKELAHGEVRRVRRRRDQSRHRRQEVRPGRARLDRAAERQRQEGARRRVHAGRERRGREAGRAPTSSAWTISPSACRAASSISTS